MPHRRTPSLIVTAATAATAALALASSAASAAPIPLPHHRSGDGASHASHHGRAGRPMPIDITNGTGIGSINNITNTSDITRIADGVGDLGVVDRQIGREIRRRGHHGSKGHHGQQGQRGGHGRQDGQGGGGRRGPDRGADRRSAPGDHLTVTVHDSGSARTDGTFELYCHPGGGSHLDAKRACDKLDGMTRWGKDPFAPVPQSAQCTMMYGGPATAHVTGSWAGRPINADFKRTDGCEISRWSRFEPLLPRTTL
ncbi:SSI family serine proteinase inhibitor [Streptomyces sp. NPDC048595]|uniref:SSI family serine proteinase inhibitor n=1 Tax=Streptomyces sp. NPDC048595 TaxID=3365576 RepID=UPI003714880E